MKKLPIILGIALCAMVLSALPADAQYVRKSYKKQQQNSVSGPSKTSVDYAKRVAATCSGGRWEEYPCLKAVSENALVMASNYGAKLQERGKNKDSERIKEHCAAATAASRESFPAYAMRSAYVECVNMIYDVTQSSGMSPDLSQYQLLVGAVQCLDKTVACRGIEQGLQKYK